jgi:hypothetical protein
VGALVAEAGAIAGVVVRVARERRRDPITVTLEVVDPVSGSSRGASSSVAVVPDAPEPLTTLVGEVRGLLPAPPARSSLLMAVNADGATVSVNGQSVGQAPLAPIDLPPGRYTVRATLPGYGDAEAAVTIARGEHARVNLDLSRGGESTAETTYGEEAPVDDDDPPIYTRWYVLTGAGVVVVGAAVLIAVVASGDSERNVQAVAVPPIE